MEESPQQRHRYSAILLFQSHAGIWMKSDWRGALTKAVRLNGRKTWCPLISLWLRTLLLEDQREDGGGNGNTAIKPQPVSPQIKCLNHLDFFPPAIIALSLCMDCMSRVGWLRSRHASLLKPGDYGRFRFSHLSLEKTILHSFTMVEFEGKFSFELIMDAERAREERRRSSMREMLSSKVWMPELVVCLVDA